VKCADVVLVESEPQRQFFIVKFGQSDKYKVIYTSADEEVLEEGIEKYNQTKAATPLPFTVLFRGSLTPEAGLDTILKAASILEKNYPQEQVKFKLFGRGIYEEYVRKLISELNLKTVELNTEKLPWPELIEKMLECSVSLGQFSTNPRLDRTIPHKAYESMVLKLPYITARAPGISSVMEDGLHCLMVNPADADDLVAKILELKNSPEMRKGLAESACRLFMEKLSPTVMAREITALI
jgi:glycosyltransferase involved in cell wall biosynthesis